MDAFPLSLSQCEAYAHGDHLKVVEGSQADRREVTCDEDRIYVV